jgi:hypothetical protein
MLEKSRSTREPASAEAEALAGGLLSLALAGDPTSEAGYKWSRLYLNFVEVREIREDDLPLLIDAARREHQLYHEILCQLAADLTLCGRPLPIALQEYMTVDAPAFKRRRGHPRGGDTFRDAAIAAAVQAVVEQGFNRTRNRRRRGDASACSIVAEVLRKRFRFNITEAGVEKIWERFRNTAAVLLPHMEENPPPLPAPE